MTKENKGEKRRYPKDHPNVVGLTDGRERTLAPGIQKRLNVPYSKAIRIAKEQILREQDEIFQKNRANLTKKREAVKTRLGCDRGKKKP